MATKSQNEASPMTTAMTANPLSSSSAFTANLTPEAAAKLKAAAAAELQARKLKKAKAGESVAGTLDARILARIFGLVAHVQLPAESDDTTPSKDKQKPPSPKPHRLLPFLLVNRHWNAAGTPLLYARISLTGQSGSWVAKKLRRTLEGGQLVVRTLLLDSELSTLAQVAEETKDHIRIVRACAGGLREVTILGYHTHANHAYTQALTGCHALTTLNISEGVSGLFTFAGLVRLMAGWPALERMVLKDVLKDAEDESAPSAASASCKQLKMVKIIDTFAPAQQVSFIKFAKAAPSLGVLWVEQRKQKESQSLPGDDLLDALGLWAGTLEALCVLAEEEVHLERILPSLPALRQLDVTASVLQPTLDALKAASASLPPASTLSPPPASSTLSPTSRGIHTLTYHRLPPALLPVLAESLAGEGVFPALRCLVLKNGSGEREKAKERAKKAEKETDRGWTANGTHRLGFGLGGKSKSKSVYGVPTRDVPEHNTTRVHWDSAVAVAAPPSLVVGNSISGVGYPPSAVQAIKAVCRRRRVRVVM
ncbi:hypothetical protein C8F01DRAFT_1176832 [Mycena amicta]|nr:hypothetical protein C8F01DRAFT_1176832 [Mycena amicta]